MTLEEKVAQLLHPWESLDPAGVYKQFNKTGLGSCAYDTLHVFVPEAWSCNSTQEYPSFT